jgi:YVTN family beta-propeller protein
VIDGAPNTTTRVSDPNATQPTALAVNPVTDTIYVANLTSNNISVIDGSTNQVTTVTDPNAKYPCAIATNSITNQIYVANSQSNNISVIDGLTNQVSTISAGAGCGLALNWATNEIYAANNTDVTVINGFTQTATTITAPNALDGRSLAVDVATNTIFVANGGSGNVTVIDGVTNSATTIQDRNEAGSPSFVVVNPVTQKVYVTNTNGYTTNNISVIAEHQVVPIPLQVTIHPLALNKTNNPTPAFTLTAKDTFSPNATVIDGVHYQVDTLQGVWLKAKSTGSGTYKGKISSPLTLGMHVLYAYATDGQEATDTNPDPGASPLVGSVAAYAFLVY